jgi:hypothetical protein
MERAEISENYVITWKSCRSIYSVGILRRLRPNAVILKLFSTRLAAAKKFRISFNSIV